MSTNVLFRTTFHHEEPTSISIPADSTYVDFLEIAGRHFSITFSKIYIPGLGTFDNIGKKIPASNVIYILFTADESVEAFLDDNITYYFEDFDFNGIVINFTINDNPNTYHYLATDETIGDLLAYSRLNFPTSNLQSVSVDSIEISLDTLIYSMPLYIDNVSNAIFKIIGGNLRQEEEDEASSSFLEDVEIENSSLSQCGSSYELNNESPIIFGDFSEMIDSHCSEAEGEMENCDENEDSSSSFPDFDYIINTNDATEIFRNIGVNVEEPDPEHFQEKITRKKLEYELFKIKYYVNGSNFFQTVTIDSNKIVGTFIEETMRHMDLYMFCSNIRIHSLELLETYRNVILEFRNDRLENTNKLIFYYNIPKDRHVYFEVIQQSMTGLDILRRINYKNKGIEYNRIFDQEGIFEIDVYKEIDEEMCQNNIFKLSQCDSPLFRYKINDEMQLKVQQMIEDYIPERIEKGKIQVFCSVSPKLMFEGILMNSIDDIKQDLGIENDRKLFINEKCENVYYLVPFHKTYEERTFSKIDQIRISDFDFLESSQAAISQLCCFFVSLSEVETKWADDLINRIEISTGFFPLINSLRKIRGGVDVEYSDLVVAALSFKTILFGLFRSIIPRAQQFEYLDQVICVMSHIPKQTKNKQVRFKTNIRAFDICSIEQIDIYSYPIIVKKKSGSYAIRVNKSIFFDPLYGLGPYEFLKNQLIQKTYESDSAIMIVFNNSNSFNSSLDGFKCKSNEISRKYVVDQYISIILDNIQMGKEKTFLSLNGSLFIDSIDVFSDLFYNLENNIPIKNSLIENRFDQFANSVKKKIIYITDEEVDLEFDSSIIIDIILVSGNGSIEIDEMKEQCEDSGGIFTHIKSINDMFLTKNQIKLSKTDLVTSRTFSFIDQTNVLNNSTLKVINEIDNERNDMKIYIDKDNIKHWIVIIVGPIGSEYCNKWWLLDILIEEEIKVRFISIPYHLNISRNGLICDEFVATHCRETKNVFALINRIIFLLEFPIDTSIVEIDRYLNYKTDKPEYMRLARKSSQENGKDSYKEYLEGIIVNDFFIQKENNKVSIKDMPFHINLE